MGDPRYWAAVMTVDGDVLEAVARLFDRPAWHQHAACRGAGTAVFFPAVGASDYTEARSLCGGCPVAEQCAEAGRDERAGLWAGLTPSQRAGRRRTAA